jgi:hypothetical protein
MPDAKLSKFFDFNEGDLAANRSGRLTPGQKEKLDTQLKAYKGNYLNRGLIVVVALVIFVVIAGAAMLKLPEEVRGAISPRMFVGPIGIVVVLVILFMRGNKTVNTAVKKAEGPVNIVRVEKEVIDHARGAGKNQIFRKKIQVYEMRVGGAKFDNVSEELPNLIQQGDEYAFYYTSHPFRILSAESLKKT